jgi:anti-sigma28 factor (negative regulator of flagellin synthesis)
LFAGCALKKSQVQSAQAEKPVVQITGVRNVAAKHLNRPKNNVLDEKSRGSPGLDALPARMDFDAAKVARLMQDMAAGRYQINPEAIADKIIAQSPSVVLGQFTH